MGTKKHSVESAKPTTHSGWVSATVTVYLNFNVDAVTADEAEILMIKEAEVTPFDEWEMDDFPGAADFEAKVTGGA